MQKVVECQLCGYQEPDLSIIQSLTNCGSLPTISCLGCHSITNKYKATEIGGKPKQIVQKSKGFTFEEIKELARKASAFKMRNGAYQGGEYAIWLGHKWKDNPWQRLVIIHQEDEYHPYTVYKEMEDRTWDIDLVYPNVGSIISHYRCLGDLKFPERKGTGTYVLGT